MDNPHLSRPWLLLTASSDEPRISGASLVNLNAVRVVEVISETEIKLRLGDQYTIGVTGTGATEFLAFLMSQAILLDGSPFPLPPEPE